MPATVELKENGRIICLVLTGDWTMQEVLDLDTQLVGYIRQARHRVHLVFDVSQTDIIPQHFTKLSKSARFVEPNFGYTAVVSENFGLQLLSEIVGKLINYNKNRYFRSREIAFAFLRNAIQKEQSSGEQKAAVGC